MKKTVLFSSALLAAMAASAQTWDAAAVGEGDFYLYNVGAGQFVQGGNSWGTQISLHQGGQLVTLEANGDGFNIDSHISSGGARHYFGGEEYLDGAASAYTFEELEGGAYAIKAANGSYMYAEAGNSLVKHSADADLTSPYAQWKLLSVEALRADMANASLANPIDVTPLIYCAGFGRNNTYIDRWDGGPARGGDNTNMCAEKWNTNFDVNQIIENLPAGNYKLMVQGFYRAGDPNALNEETASVLNAILYANSVEQPLVSIQSEGANPAVVGNSYGAGTLPNSMAQASSCFSNGLYENVMKFKLAEAGDVTIGIKKDELIGNDWSIFDNFRLIYTGVPDFTAVSALAEQAKGLTAPHDTDLDEKLGAAISYAEQVVTEQDEDNMEAAVEALQAAMDLVNASIAQYEAVKAAIEAADVKAAAFDEAGQAAYNKQITYAKADYEAGEVNFNEAGGNGIYTVIQDALAAGAAAQTSRGADMTSLIVNADFNTGNLSGWTAVNAQWQNNNTYGPINRFAEKWVQAPGTLDDCSLTQTVTLGMGVYVLEADVVATQQGGVPEEGIVGMSLVAGDQSVACSTGNGEATHYAVEFTAPYTQNTVELGFKVEGTNGNWWAVDNFKLTLKHVILPEPELSELYFEEYDAMDNGICTYAKDMEKNGTTYAQMQPITSEGMASAWEAVDNGDAKAAGIFEYGSEAWLGAEGYLAPAEGSVEGSNHALGINAVWGATTQYTRTYGLPKGCYKIKAAVYNAANGEAGGTDVAANKIGYIAEDGTEFFMATKSFPKGEWTEDEVLVRITDDYSVGKLSVGVAGLGSGTASSAHLFLDYVTVEPVSAVEFYYEELMAISEEHEDIVEGIDSKEGDGVFMYAEGSSDNVRIAWQSLCKLQEMGGTDDEWAEAYDAFKSTLTPAVNQPEAGVFYTLKNANADVYMSVAGEGVTVENDPSKFLLVEAENGWQLKSGDHYVGMAGTNNWTMSNEKADAWTITYVGNGKYTLKGSKGMIGTDKLDAGSACYGDKNASKNGEWIIETALGDLTLESTYAENLSSCVINVAPLSEDHALIYTLDGEAEDAKYMLVEGAINVAWTEGVADEQGVCKYVVVVKEVELDENGAIVKTYAMGYDEISLIAAKAELELTSAYNEDLSSCVVTVPEPAEGHVQIYTLKAEDEDPEYQLVEGDIVLAWAPGMADEFGVCKYELLVQEVEMDEDGVIVKVYAQGFEEISLIAPAVPLEIATEYNADNSVCVVSAEPTEEGTYMFISIDGGEEFMELPAEGYTVAWLKELADEQGVCIYNIVVREVKMTYDEDQEMDVVETVNEGTEQVHLVAPAPTHDIQFAFNEDYSAAVVTAEPTEEGTEMLISIDGGEEFMELPADGYTVAWLESLADEQGICLYNIVVREMKTTYDEDLEMDVTEIVCETLDQLHLSKPLADGIALVAGKTQSESIFDLMGRKISNIVKGGMYIINGKKVLKK